MSKGGRPTDYTEELADRICEEIADGKSVRELSLQDDYPAMSTIFRWLADSDKSYFTEQYARAKEAHAEYLAEEILDICDNANNDWMERNSEGNEGWQINGEAIQRSRLRIDSRKWLLGKIKPKKYGDKQFIDHTTKGEAIQKDVRSLTTAELEAYIAANKDK